MGNDGHYASIFTNSKLFKKLVNTNISPRYLVTEKIGHPKVNESYHESINDIVIKKNIFNSKYQT